MALLTLPLLPLLTLALLAFLALSLLTLLALLAVLPLLALLVGRLLAALLNPLFERLEASHQVPGLVERLLQPGAL